MAAVGDVHAKLLACLRMAAPSSGTTDGERQAALNAAAQLVEKLSTAATQAPPPAPEPTATQTPEQAGERFVNFTDLIREARGEKGAGRRVDRREWERLCGNVATFEQRWR